MPKKKNDLGGITHAAVQLQGRTTRMPKAGHEQEAYSLGNKGGRKSSFNPDIHLPLIEDLAIRGAYHQDIYKALGISAETWVQWRLRFPAIVEVLERAYMHRVRNTQVAASRGLLQLVEGYDEEEVDQEFEYVTDEKGRKKKILAREKVRKRHRAPHPTAVIFALTNLDTKNFPGNRVGNGNVTLIEQANKVVPSGAKGLTSNMVELLERMAEDCTYEGIETDTGE